MSGVIQLDVGNCDERSPSASSSSSSSSPMATAGACSENYKSDDSDDSQPCPAAAASTTYSSLDKPLTTVAVRSAIIQHINCSVRLGRWTSTAATVRTEFRHGRVAIQVGNISPLQYPTVRLSVRQPSMPCRCRPSSKQSSRAKWPNTVLRSGSHELLYPPPGPRCQESDRAYAARRGAHRRHGTTVVGTEGVGGPLLVSAPEILPSPPHAESIQLSQLHQQPTPADAVQPPATCRPARLPAVNVPSAVWLTTVHHSPEYRLLRHMHTPLAKTLVAEDVLYIPSCVNGVAAASTR